MRPVDLLVFSLQDHDKDQETRGRAVPKAYRTERTTESGDPVAEGHSAPDAEGDHVSTAPEKTLGDIHGGFVVKNEKGKREEPMWSFAFAGVTTEPSRDLRPPQVITETAGATTTVPRGAQTSPSTSGDPAKQRVRVRLVKDAAFTPEDRFQPVDCALSPNSPALPKGFPGVILVTTQERKQVEVFLPSGGAPLIAVDHAGPPSLASLVSDLTPAGEIDKDRQARLHTHMRVVRLNPTCSGLPVNNALAWQLKPATQDGFAGGGLVVDFASVGAVTAESEAASPTTPTPPPKREATPGGTQLGAVTDVTTAVTPDSHSGQSGGVVIIGPDGKIRRQNATQTRTGPPPTAPRSGVPTNPTAVQRVVVGVCSRTHGGPFEVGRADDVHRIGTTKDGEPINSTHLPIGALFLDPDGPGDGPLDFNTKEQYGSPAKFPLFSEADILWDSSAVHDHPCGPKPGRWRVRARVPFYVPEPPKKPRRPPPPEDLPPLVVVRSPEAQPRTPQLVVTPEGRRAHTPPGAPATGPTHKPQPDPTPPQTPTAPQTIRFGGGMLLRPFPWATGSPNATGVGGTYPLSNETLAGLDKAPDVVQIQPVAPGDGQVDGWTGKSQKPDGTETAAGAMTVLPASANFFDAVSTFVSNAASALVQIGGGIAATNTSGVIQSLLTATGGIRMKEQTAPSTPPSGYSELYVKSDGKLYLKDDAGTETDVAAGSGGGISVRALFGQPGNNDSGAASNGMPWGRVGYAALSGTLYTGFTTETRFAAGALSGNYGMITTATISNLNPGGATPVNAFDIEWSCGEPLPLDFAGFGADGLRLRLAVGGLTGEGATIDWTFGYIAPGTASTFTAIGATTTSTSSDLAFHTFQVSQSALDAIGYTGGDVLHFRLRFRITTKGSAIDAQCEIGFGSIHIDLDA